MKIKLPNSNSDSSIKKEIRSKSKKNKSNEVKWIEMEDSIKGYISNKEVNICKETFTLKLNSFMKIKCDSLEKAKNKALELLK